MRIPIAVLALVACSSVPAFAQRAGSPVLFQTPGTAASQAPKVNLPAGVHVGVISFDSVASKSQTGKAVLFQLQTLQTRKGIELQGMQTRLQTLRSQQQTQSAVVNEAAAAAMERDINKLTRELQYAQQEAEVEVQDLRDQLMQDLQKRVSVVVAQVAKEKGLLLVVQAESAVYFDPALDLSDEVARRLDSTTKGLP